MDDRVDLPTALQRQGVHSVAVADDQVPGVMRQILDGAVFNGAVKEQPRGIVECVDEASVKAALRVASEHGIPVSVLAGGHDPSGRSFGADNLVFDIRRLAQVRVDRAAGEVTLGGGTLTQHLLEALPDDLVTVTGTVGSVGVVGLTLGGGYGRLNSRFGLALDCMRRARVVLADGSVVTASEDDDADLFWALRGGGSGFGVVTSLTMALHTLPQVWTAMILVPLEHAREGLLNAQELIDQHPVQLSIFMGFMTAPTGRPVLFLAPLWSGDPAMSEALVQRLSFEGAQILQQGWGPYKNTFDPESEKAWPKGRHYHIPTQTLRRIDDQAARVLVDGARRMTSHNAAIVLHDFHGEPTRIAPDATAFPLRDPHFVIEVIGAWDHASAEDDARHRGWAENVSADLAQLAMSGGYVNLLLPFEEERVRLFYGSAAQRLWTVKRLVDPGDLFRSGVGRLGAES